jgi:hypothetical protein
MAHKNGKLHNASTLHIVAAVIRTWSWEEALSVDNKIHKFKLQIRSQYQTTAVLFANSKPRLHIAYIISKFGGDKF